MNEEEVIYVLRKEEETDTLTVETVEVKFPYQDDLEGFERLYGDPNASLLDLQGLVQRTSLKELTKAIDYCSTLDAAWESDRFMGMNLMTVDEYRSEISRGADPTRTMLYLKENFYKAIKKRVVPYAVTHQYGILDDDRSVLAYSHRRCGWSFPLFHLDNDVKVCYQTNFGYGRSSYFYTQIFYKGIAILPYSDWVLYRYAKMIEIIKYTKVHLVQNGYEEWKDTLMITADIYNLAARDPERFVKDYIIGEVEKMVSGLEDILNADQTYRIVTSKHNSKTQITLTGDLLVLFKGEKISGALSFLDQLLKLVPVFNDVVSYMQRIMNCNLAIIGELQGTISRMMEEVKSLEQDIERLTLDYTRLKDLHEERMESKRREEKEALAGNSSICDETDFGQFKKVIQKIHDSFDEVKYEEVHKKYEEMCSSRDKIKGFIQKLSDYLKTIEKHRGYMTEKNLTA